jgi:alpha-ketoglutarate-dependent taurine dioxygenase
MAKSKSTYACPLPTTCDLLTCNSAPSSLSARCERDHCHLARATGDRKPRQLQTGGASRWHTDLVHERQPAGVTHLHNDTIPKVGGDTLWASGYAAYEKLSPEFRKIIDGRQAVYRSAHPYLDRENPSAGPKYVERTHPLVRVHPATGWKALWVNRAMTSRIVGLDKAESDIILNYLYDVVS